MVPKSEWNTAAAPAYARRYSCSVARMSVSVNPLQFRSNYSAAWNNMKLVHWPLMGGLLHLVQRGGDWAGPTSPYREVCRGKGGIGSGETLCHIYPARPITTVSLATNTYCMMDGDSSCAPRTVGLRVQFSGTCEESHWSARHTAGGHLLWVVQAATNTERL